MPAWITLTLADLNDARVAELVEAVRREELAPGQTDPLARRIQIVVNEIRHCIAYDGGTPLETDPATIPSGLKELAVEKIFRGLKLRLLLPFTDAEKEGERLYQKRLEQLTRGEWPVDQPAVPLLTPTVQPSTGVALAGTPARRQATITTLRDLI